MTPAEIRRKESLDGAWGTAYVGSKLDDFLEESASFCGETGFEEGGGNLGEDHCGARGLRRALDSATRR